MPVPPVSVAVGDPVCAPPVAVAVGELVGELVVGELVVGELVGELGPDVGDVLPVDGEVGDVGETGGLVVGPGDVVVGCGSDGTTMTVGGFFGVGTCTRMITTTSRPLWRWCRFLTS
ncbi:hypothetical protein ABZ636_01390 [Streptomyces sp. NPDC007251]|uniref:hypothetical protein n=1 Tax=Streptomyces sp. NPDC007251 TaxID=3154483 RepID=UPI0033D4C592